MKWLKRTAAAGMTAVMLFSCLPAAGAVQPGEELTRGETASILLEAATDYNADVPSITEYAATYKINPATDMVLPVPSSSWSLD